MQGDKVIRSIGGQIRGYRTHLGMTQEDVQRASTKYTKGGVPLAIGTISDWERDKQVPSLVNLLVLTQIFGVGLDALIWQAPGEEDSKTEGVEQSAGRAMEFLGMAMRTLDEGISQPADCAVKMVEARAFLRPVVEALSSR